MGKSFVFACIFTNGESNYVEIKLAQRTINRPTLKVLSSNEIFINTNKDDNLLTN